MLLLVWIVDDSFEMSERGLCKKKRGWARERKEKSEKERGKGKNRSV